MPYQVFTDGQIPDQDDFNTYLMRQVTVVCTSGTRPASPPAGMCIYETDTKTFRHYNGSAWQRHAYSFETFATVQSTDNTVISVSSTTFAAGSPAVSTTFVAPPSGRVKVTVSGQITQSVNGNETKLSYEIRAGAVVGSGAIHTAASNDNCLTAGKAVNTGGASLAGASYGPYLILSLTPLDTYNIRTMHRVTGGNGDVAYRAILVEPVG